MNPDKWESQIQLGEEANRIYQSELVQGFLKDLDKSLWEAFKQSPADDYEGREKVYSMMKLAGKFEGMFLQYIAGGKTASQMLEKLKDGAFDNI